MFAIRSLFSFINVSLQKQPMASQMIISGTIFAAGDASCQFLIHPENNKYLKEIGINISNLLKQDKNDKVWKFDWYRCLKMFSVGFLVEGPLAKLWYLHV